MARSGRGAPVFSTYVTAMEQLLSGSRGAALGPWGSVWNERSYKEQK